MIGIYKITNLVNNKFYIGSSKNIKYRWAAHLCQLRKNKHINFYLQSSFNLHKEKNFKFETLEQCLISDLITKEQYWIDTLLPEYNIRQKCENNTGFKHSITTKNKISKKSKELWKYNRTKMIESIQKPILAYNKQGNYVKEYKSVKEAAKELNVASTNISSVLKGKNIFIKNCHFIYKFDSIPSNITIPKRKNRGTIGAANKEKAELWLDSQLIKIFDSKKELAEYLKLSPSIISQIKSGVYYKNHPKTKIPKYIIKEII